MRVCIDLSAALQQSAGIGRFGRELFPRLQAALAPDHLSIFTNNCRRITLPPTVAPYRRYGIGLGNKLWRLRVARDYLVGGHLDEPFSGVDVFFAADHLLPRFHTIRGILTIHDLSYVLYPQFHSRYNRFYQRLMMPTFARHATHIVVPSLATQRDVIAHYQIPLERISVIPEGVDDAFRAPVAEGARRRVRQTYSIPNPFILFVGTLEPRKNIAGLLDAFAGLLHVSGQPLLDLVLAGKLGWMYEPILARVKTLGLEARVRLIGFVPDDDLPALYSAAEIFVFPSWFEGFGLPPLEAMACGTPVVASRAGSLAEVVGDAGLLVDPADSQELTTALRSVLEQPALRARLRAAGPLQAAPFTWDRAARATASLCRDVAQ